MSEPLDLATDVLVIGGGPAGTWAALNARKSGADVILVDKGYCGTSGATAPSGTGVWYVAPDPEQRTKAKASREALGGYLADHAWMDRVLDRTYENMHLLGDEGRSHPRSLTGAGVVGRPRRGRARRCRVPTSTMCGRTRAEPSSLRGRVRPSVEEVDPSPESPGSDPHCAVYEERCAAE